MTSTIDTHLHLWDFDEADYPWLTASNGPLLYRSCRPEEVGPQLPQAGVGRAILVQASEVDTDYLLTMAERHEFVAGVVGWLPLDDLDATDQRMSSLEGSALVGVRYDMARCAAVSQRALALLEHTGLSLDLAPATPGELDQVAGLAARAPGVRMIVDHLGNPPAQIASLPEWGEALRRAADHPNVYAKVSGLGTADRRRAWDRTGLAPVVDCAVAAFGADRLMVGSDWPVSTQVSEYVMTMDVQKELLQKLLPSSQKNVLAETARSAYPLGRWT